LKNVDNSAKHSASIIRDEENAKEATLTSLKQTARIIHQAQGRAVLNASIDRVVCLVISK
jgi:hypothetical protein